jgi:hypothetical protein
VSTGSGASNCCAAAAGSAGAGACGCSVAMSPASASRTLSASLWSMVECALRVRPSNSASASSTRLLVVPSTLASE